MGIMGTYHHFFLCSDVRKELGTTSVAGGEIGNAINATDGFKVVVGTRTPDVTCGGQVGLDLKLLQFRTEIKRKNVKKKQHQNPKDSDT